MSRRTAQVTLIEDDWKLWQVGHYRETCGKSIVMLQIHYSIQLSSLVVQWASIQFILDHLVNFIDNRVAWWTYGAKKFLINPLDSPIEKAVFLVGIYRTVHLSCSFEKSEMTLQMHI